MCTDVSSFANLAKLHFKDKVLAYCDRQVAVMMITCPNMEEEEEEEDEYLEGGNMDIIDWLKWVPGMFDNLVLKGVHLK